MKANAPISPAARQYRDTMGLFATGVAVVAAHTGEDVHGMTANAVTSLSLEPMLLLFCPAKKSRLAHALAVGTPFSVNFLRATQQSISTYFAGGWREPEPPPFRFTHLGEAPRLEDALACIGCTVRHMVDGGDHWIVIGEVFELQQGSAPQEPLLFYRGQYRQLGIGAAATAPDLTAVTNEPQHVHFEPEG